MYNSDEYYIEYLAGKWNLGGWKSNYHTNTCKYHIHKNELMGKHIIGEKCFDSNDPNLQNKNSTPKGKFERYDTTRKVARKLQKIK